MGPPSMAPAARLVSLSKGVMEPGPSRAGFTMTERTEMASNEAQLTSKVATGRRKAQTPTMTRCIDL